MLDPDTCVFVESGLGSESDICIDVVCHILHYCLDTIT